MMNRIYMLLIVSIASCNIISAAAIDYEGFYEAIEKNDIEGVQGFLEQGADVHYKKFSSCTPLHKASYCGYVTLAEMFLERGACVDEKTDLRDTPLLLAVSEYKGSSTGLVRLLLERGADVNAKDISERTPLHYVARKGHVEVVKVLLEWGANKGLINASGTTAAEEARQNGHNELAEFIESWEPLEIKEPEMG